MIPMIKENKLGLQDGYCSIQEVKAISDNL